MTETPSKPVTLESLMPEVAGHPAPGALPKTEPAYKYKRQRDYSNGSLVDRIAKCDTKEELEEIRRTVLLLRRRGQLAGRTLRRIDRVGAAKATELNNALIMRVPRKKIAIPEGAIVSPGGIILP